MTDNKPKENSTQKLGASAKASLLWGGGSTLLRDLVQFSTMLVLIRLLTPEDYGRFALAQSIIGLIHVFSFGTFINHALQNRNPDDVDWQAHFTFGTAINLFLFLVTLLIAWLLYKTEQYHEVALPLVGLATVFIVEVAGALRQRMLEIQHQWKRFRTLMIMGSILGAVAGIIVAMAGGGYWALVIQVPLLGLPAVVDLVWKSDWRPAWSWSLKRYRASIDFALKRMGGALANRGMHTVEQGLLAGTYNFADLGVFTRTIGLASLIAGRIGTIAMMALYPVITRAEERSERFQRIARLVFSGVSWTTIPAAVFLAVSAEEIVALLYGTKWSAVAPLLPLGVMGVALTGMATAVSSLLLANNEVKASMYLEIFGAVLGVGMALWLIPKGVDLYLIGLAVNGSVVLGLTLIVLICTRGIKPIAIFYALFPAVLAGAVGVLAIEGVRFLQPEDAALIMRLGTEAIVFSAAYLIVMRIGFPSSIREFLSVMPAGKKLAGFMML